MKLINKVWFYVKELIFLVTYKDRKKRFAVIFERNMWKNVESKSGFGSTLEATRQARAGLDLLLGKYGITSVLDVPCGDYNWFKEVTFEGSYIGVDIVPQLIDDNTENFGTERVKFLCLDMVEDDLPPAELVFCRECLNHLSLDDGRNSLSSLFSSAIRFVVATHYPEVRKNAEQNSSFRYRPLNLTIPPFNLRAPDLLIDESLSEPGKVLAVWDKKAEVSEPV